MKILPENPEFQGGEFWHKGRSISAENTSLPEEVVIWNPKAEHLNTPSE
jgi:hypothetical protein